METPSKSKFHSVSQIPLFLEIPGKGQINCQIFRHLSPITISAIIRRLPLSGLVHRFKNSMIYFESGLNIGAEKQKDIFKKGDLTFMVANGAICIIVENIRGIPMNALGRLENMDLLNTISVGDALILKAQ
jgi:hypothetical protein